MGHMFANVRGGEANEAPSASRNTAEDVRNTGREGGIDDADDEERTSGAFEILLLPLFCGIALNFRFSRKVPLKRLMCESKDGNRELMSCVLMWNTSKECLI